MRDFDPDYRRFGSKHDYPLSADFVAKLFDDFGKP
jgi:hypothetical protein